MTKIEKIREALKTSRRTATFFFEDSDGDARSRADSMISTFDLVLELIDEIEKEELESTTPTEK